MRRSRISNFAAGAAFMLVLVGASKVLHADPPASFAAGETLTSAKLNGNFAALSARLDALERQPPQVPTGTIVAYAGDVIPPGWLLCDGSSVARADKALLFAAIGTAWGSGDNATTFNVPDLRGRFLRGVDRAVGRDPDRAARVANAAGGNMGDAVGSAQGDALVNHTHNYTYDTLTGIGYSGGGAPAYTVAAQSAINTAGVNGGIATNETRPKNSNVNYIIKE